MDLLALALVLPFLIGALMAHFGHDFTDPKWRDK